MNSERGAAMLAAIRPGSLVTVRHPFTGGTMTGRARAKATGGYALELAGGARVECVNAVNVVQVRTA